MTGHYLAWRRSGRPVFADLPATAERELHQAGTNHRDAHGSAASATAVPGLPAVVGRADFEAERAGLLAREKAHTREGDAIAAARRRLPATRRRPL